MGALQCRLVNDLPDFMFQQGGCLNKVCPIGIDDQVAKGASTIALCNHDPNAILLSVREHPASSLRDD
jgi:hypothetical protein